MPESMTLQVGIGDLKTGKGPGVVLVAYGLGSCVGISLYDPMTQVGGLAHVMLPSSLEAVSRADGRFADRAVPMLMEGVLSLGADQRRLVGKIVGGARMLVAPGFTDSFNIGARNVEAARSLLGQLGVRLVASETGGCRGRTVLLSLASGMVVVRTVGEEEVNL